MEKRNLFSRETIIEGIDLMRNFTHPEIDRALLFFSIEEASPDRTHARYRRVNEIIAYLIADMGRKGPKGNNIIFEIFEYILKIFKQRHLEPSQEFLNSLKSDGFIVDNYMIVSALSDTIDLPEKKIEIIELLDRYSFNISKGHLEQAISAHTRGDWAAANSQLRTYVEDLFDRIADKLKNVGDTLPSSSHARREYLANLTPPFIIPDLNEWEIGDKGGFFQGFYKLLHPTGSHPGLSDEFCCTFRLHLTLVVSHNLLKRLENRV